MKRRVDSSLSDRVARLAQLHGEVDSVRAAAADRARSVDSKASFLVVAAGVLVPATLIDRGGGHVALDVLPLGFTLLSIVFATVALSPRKRLDLGAATAVRPLLRL